MGIDYEKYREVLNHKNVRRGAVETSRDAEAFNAGTNRITQCAKFHAALLEAGWYGMTNHEVHLKVLGFGYSATPRLNDLRLMGLAVRTGAKRIPHGKTRPQMVWVATEYWI